MVKAVINLQQLKHEVKGTQMMKKLTNVHLQLKSAFQKGDGNKTVRNLNKKVQTFCTDWKNRAILRLKKTPGTYGNQVHTRTVTNRHGEA